MTFCIGVRSAKISRASRPAFSSRRSSSGSNFASLAASSRSCRTRSTKSTTGFSKGRTNAAMDRCTLIKEGTGAPRVSLWAQFCKHGATTHHDAMGQMTETAAGSLESPGERRADRWGPLLVLGLARLAVSWAASETGLMALSDDDYARVVIAQSFASQPKLDPSGTSWLPFPFWVTGTVMKVLDPSLGVARAASSALAIGATWLVFAAGRMWGFTDRQALLGALGATALPAVMVLGSVTVPELPTAALCAFALVAVSASSVAAGPSALAGPSTPPSAKRRAWSPALLAGTAMLAATLSRYEAWPIAVVVSTFAFLGKDEPVLWKRILSVALPLVGPAGWILHNRLVHGDALVFL